MDIGIDAHHLDGKPQGSRTYLLGLIPELARLAPADRFFLYSFNPAATRDILDAPNIVHRRVFPESARIRIPLVVPALELIDGVKVFHSQYICPPISFVPEVVSIHDILFETHPDLFVGAFSRASVWLMRRSAQRARYVLTVSEFSRRALLERYELPEDKVVVTLDAVDPKRFRPLESGPDLDDVRRRYHLDRPFILNVGRLEPRKNLERLIRAFHRVRESIDKSLQLIVVGQDDFRFETVHRVAEKLPDGTVRFLGPCRTPIYRPFTISPASWHTHRSSKDSACRSWRRWPAALPWSLHEEGPYRKWGETPLCGSTRRMKIRSPPAWNRP